MPRRGGASRQSREWDEPVEHRRRSGGGVLKAVLIAAVVIVIFLAGAIAVLNIYMGNRDATNRSVTASGPATGPAEAENFTGKALRMPKPILPPPDKNDPIGAVLQTVAEIDHNIPETLVQPPPPDNPESAQREKEVIAAMATAAREGYMNAQYAYGRIIMQGRAGKEPDINGAMDWIKRAAEQGQTHAQVLYGYLAGYGAGMPRNLGDAFLWWTIAAAQGSEAAAIGRDKLAAFIPPSEFIRLKALAKRWQTIHEQIKEPPLPVAEQQAQAVALIRAAADGDEKKVRQILAKGGDPNQVDEAGHTALINAAWRGQPATIEVLLTAGADLNFVGKDGRTALGWGAANKYESVVRLLIEAGANVDVPDTKGLTPLMRSAWLGFTGVTSLLLQAGASPRKTDNEGKTAIDYARIDGTPALLKLFNAS